MACCFDIIGRVGTFLKTSIFLCCFLLIGGPVLIIVGSVQLTKDTGLKEFKRVVKNFDPTPINTWTGTVNEAPATVRHLPLNVDGVDGATSVFTEAFFLAPRKVKNNAFGVDVNINGVMSFSRYVSWPYERKDKYICKMIDCSSPGKKCSCDVKHMEFKMNCELSGGEFDRKESSCTLGKECGRCKLDMYPSTLYLVARETGFGQYVEDVIYRSAKYDFTETAHDYQTVKPNNIVVRLYSEKDPFIALQRITEGTNQFQKEDHIIGIVLIIIGSVLLLLGMGVCTILSCYCVREKRKSANMPMELSSLPPAATNASAGAQATTEGPSMQQQNYVYGQPLSQQEAYSPREELPAEQQAHVFRQELPVEQKDKTQKQESLTNQERNTYGQRPLYVYGLSLPPSKEENDSDLVKK